MKDVASLVDQIITGKGYNKFARLIYNSPPFPNVLRAGEYQESFLFTTWLP